MMRFLSVLFLALSLHAAGPVHCAFDSKVVSWRAYTEAAASYNAVYTHTLIASSVFMGSIRSAGLYPGNILRANLFCGRAAGGTNGAGDSTTILTIGTPQNALITDVGDPFDTCGVAQHLWKYQETGSNGGLGSVSSSSHAYFNTGVIPNSVSSWLNDAHLSIYMMSGGIESAVPVGVTQGANTAQLAPTWTGIGQYSCLWGFVGYPTAVDTNGIGFYLGTRTSGAAGGLTQYKNGVLTGTSASASGAATITTAIFVLADNDGGVPNYWTSHLSGGYTMGRGLNATQQLQLYNAMQIAQTLLQRQK